MWARRIPPFSLLFVLIVANIGCGHIGRYLPSSWHKKCGWKAENYFDDPQVIALCHAIEANDIPEIDRLVAAGANVNSQGKGKMTPLLWAYPDNKLERFKRLLEHGADPNVIIESNFNSHGGMSPGDSVTHMVSKTSFPGYFEAVFEHGGDVNLINGGMGNSHETPLFLVIEWGGSEPSKIKLLIEKGADLNYVSGSGFTPVMQAVSWFGQFDVALMLLDAGADHRVYRRTTNERLVHIVISVEREAATWTPQQAADYQRLVQWLKDHGESFEEARVDFARWSKWHVDSGEYMINMNAEIAARKAREAREKEAAEQEKAGAQQVPPPEGKP